eukprot:9986709-Ditylum_brightwellii.AAC.1
MRDDIYGFVSGFEKEAEKLEFESQKLSTTSTDHGSPAHTEFAEAFASPEMSNKYVYRGYLQAGALYREGAAFLLIGLLKTRMLKTSISTMNIFTLIKEFRQRIWKLLSNKTMRKEQQHIFDASSTESPTVCSNLPLLFTSAKVMTALTLMHLGALPGQPPSSWE